MPAQSPLDACEGAGCGTVQGVNWVHVRGYLETVIDGPIRARRAFNSEPPTKVCCHGNCAYFGAVCRHTVALCPGCRAKLSQNHKVYVAAIDTIAYARTRK